MELSEHVIEDYRTLSLSLKAHPVSFVRSNLSAMKVTATNELINGKDGMTVRVAGLVLVRQRPGTASGICFITIEDETGTSNLVVFEKLFNQYRKEIVHSRLLMVEGKIQKEGEVIHVVVSKCHNVSALLHPLSQSESKSSEHLTTDDAVSSSPGVAKTMKAQQDVFHGGRNFH
jgi:error-prone DNA polymerase